MRILFVLHQYLPDHVGGSELYTQSVTRQLARRGHEVALFYRRDLPGTGWQQSNDEGVKLYSAWAEAMSPTRRFLTTFGNSALVRHWQAVLADFQPDLVHFQHLLGLPVALVDTLSRHQVPYFVTLHDFWWVCVNANLLTNYSQKVCAGPNHHLNCTHCVVARSDNALAWLTAPPLLAALHWRAGQLRQALMQANLLLSPSRFVQNWYANHGLATTRMETLPIGLPPLPPTAGDAQPHSPLRFLYVGSLAAIKGVHIVIEAHRQLRGESELWIVGNEAVFPDYSAQLRAQAGANVRFLGLQPQHEVFRLMHECDLLLVPSLVQESFCMVAHEARAARLPAFVSAIGALSEAVEDGHNGQQLPPGDVTAWRNAMQHILDHPQQVTHFRQRITPPLTVNDHVTRLQTLYQLHSALRTLPVQPSHSAL